jgi:hypothetical protein
MAPAGFEQAAIKVENEAAFSELKNAIDRVFSALAVERFLSSVKRKNLKIREVERIIAAGLIEKADEALQRQKKTAKGIYDSLSVSDQGQIREFYLWRLEQVDSSFRATYREVYRAG